MISLKEVQKSYKTSVALENLDLQINKGEIYALLGPNGAGKTTTINLLLGFLKPDRGTVAVDGLDPVRQVGEVRRRVAYIPENVSLYPYLTGLENLDYFCKLGKLSYPRDELSAMLDKCGLAPHAHHKKLETYSKGMRQKVGIAIAYAKKARVLLLDEPASGLDPEASNELSALLQSLADDGATVLMASHDLFRVRETASRIGILHHGLLLQELEAKEISANDLESIYLQFMKN